MTKQEEIREGIAEFNYYYPDGKSTIRRKWEVLTPAEKKPYLDVASLQVFKLHSQGVVIKVDRELPYYCVCEDEFKPVTMPEPSKNDFSHSNECHLYNQGFKAGYVAVEPLLIKEVTSG